MMFEITHMDEINRVELIVRELKRTKDRMLGNTYNIGDRKKANKQQQNMGQQRR